MTTLAHESVAVMIIAMRDEVGREVENEARDDRSNDRYQYYNHAHIRTMTQNKQCFVKLGEWINK